MPLLAPPRGGGQGKAGLDGVWTRGPVGGPGPEACAAALRGYRSFLDAMAELDAHSRVLEPQPASPAHVFRRIAVGRCGGVSPSRGGSPFCTVVCLTCFFSSLEGSSP